MPDRLKKSERNSFIAITILLIALIAFIPILLNIKFLLGIGYYNFDRNYVSDYPEGSVGINIKISITHSKQGSSQCRGSILLKIFSSGNIQVYGITQIKYSIRTNNSYYSVVDEIVNPATQIWSKKFIIVVLKNDNVSCTGSAEVKYSISGSEQTVAYNFDMGYIIPINVALIYYDWDMPLIWLNFLYFTILIVVGYFFVRQLKYIRHIYTYPEEEKRRTRIFLNFYLKESQKRKNKLHFFLPLL